MRRLAGYGAAFSLTLCLVLRADSDVAPDTQRALVKLEHAAIFAIGGVGIAGVMSKEEAAFRVILSAPRAEAEAALIRIFHGGNLQAKAYALAGLQTWARNRLLAWQNKPVVILRT